MDEVLKIALITGKPAVPVHCIVELSSEAASGGWRDTPPSATPNAENRVVTDGYAIVPANTPLINLVPIALEKLGVYSESTASAKGKFLRYLPSIARKTPGSVDFSQ